MQISELNFEAEVRSEILKYFPHDRNCPTAVSELQSLDTHRLLIAYLNWRSRLIHAHPRTVYLSDRFVDSSLYAPNRSDVDRLIQKIAEGSSLSPHLSQRILKGYVRRDAARPLRDNPSLDLLLNEWGMHHVHIRHTPGRNGFFTHDNAILIGIFQDNEAFLIDVVAHGAWSDQSLVETAIRTWPKRNFFPALQGVLGLEQEISAEDRSKLRRAGVATLVEFDGKVYMPRSGGISTAGTSSRVAMEALAIQRGLRFYEEEPQRLVCAFQSALVFQGLDWPEHADIHFVLAVTPQRFSACLLERTTGRLIIIS